MTGPTAWKQEALEQLAENERVIAEQKARIAALEFHLQKLRDMLWQGYYATAEVLPFPVHDEPKAKTKAKRRGTP